MHFLQIFSFFWGSLFLLTEGELDTPPKVNITSLFTKANLTKYLWLKSSKSLWFLSGCVSGSMSASLALFGARKKMMTKFVSRRTGLYSQG